MADSLDIHFENEAHISDRARVSRREPGQGEIVSPDGNFCEFGGDAVGERFVQRITATVTGDQGNAKLTFCASMESFPSTDQTIPPAALAYAACLSPQRVSPRQRALPSAVLRIVGGNLERQD